MNNFVFPEELTYFVESMRRFQLRDVGSPKWMDVHELVVKLFQQAVFEVLEHREEMVKDSLILSDKLKVLVHEVHCIRLWKTHVLPLLLEIDPNPKATFAIYMVLFHEGVCVALLDLALFHSGGCEMLQSCALDLVDYCAHAVAQVIALVNKRLHENESKGELDEAVLTELERQRQVMDHKIGLRCISILSYLADNANVLSVSAARRMMVTHDVPWLMVDLLQSRPWQRNGPKGAQKFIDEKWTYVTGDTTRQVVKQEAQAWFCLRQLLFNNNLMQSYEIHEERRKQFAKCQGWLHDCILDQLPPLIELKEFLCNVTLSGTAAAPKANLLLEELPEINKNLIKEAERDGGYFEIAQQQESIFLQQNDDAIREMAQRLNAAYNTDMLAELEQQGGIVKLSNGTGATKVDKKCAVCAATAEQKCANCKTVFYCSRGCQLKAWPQHKLICLKGQA